MPTLPERIAELDEDQFYKIPPPGIMSAIRVAVAEVKVLRRIVAEQDDLIRLIREHGPGPEWPTIENELKRLRNQLESTGDENG